MIPKVIHYCWFGGKPKPRLARKCIRSWKKYCPGYRIIEWNESNYCIDDAPLYVRQAFQHKKWAFVSDYVRLQVVFKHGGIYFDTDVELIRPLTELTGYDAYFGFEDGRLVNTGCGFGSVKGLPLLKELMSDYADVSFVKEDGALDTIPCPDRNTAVFLKNGLVQDDSFQMIDGNICILPSEYLCPKNFKTGELHITSKTISIHHFDASWYSSKMYSEYKRKLFREKMRRLPSTIGWKIFGRDRYQKIRRRLKNLNR